MAFSQSTITAGPMAVQIGPEFLIGWSCSATPPVNFQVYIDRRLYWSGSATRCRVTIPNDGGSHEIHVGTCLPTESRTDLSASLPAPIGGTGSRAKLTWLGGTFLDPLIEGFNIYQGSAPGVAAPTSGTPAASFAAYPQGIITDGFGFGGFGDGGFGEADSSYSHTSPPLAAGTWNFAIVPFDQSGNLGTPQTTSVTIAGPPPPPPASPGNGQRISYTYSPSTQMVTLSWQGS